jgi:short-subunit dehydrogenase
MDLSKEVSYELYKKMLADNEADIVALVNAAGFGKFGEFESIPLEEQMNMIDLNCKALMAMTYISLEFMHEGSRIYQLGSLSAFQPVPYIATYGATKSFVLSFSRAINKELEKRKIRVVAVCPGWVKTEFFNRAVKDDTIKYYNKFFNSADVVRRAVYDMYRGKDVSVIGASIRAQVLLTKLLPHKAVMKIWCKQQKK